MRAHTVEVLLALLVLMGWLGAAGFARLAWLLDRLHCPTFVNVACGTLVLVAAGLSGGSADDVIKVAFLLAALLIGGAAIGHATGRAIVRRRAPR